MGDERRRHKPSRRGRGIDNRQGVPEWTADGARSFTVQERGSVRLYRLPVDGGKAEVVVSERGTVGSFSMSQNDASPTRSRRPAIWRSCIVAGPAS